MAQSLMDTKATLFEGVIIEFDWGQRGPKYRTVDITKYQPTSSQIDQEGTLKEQMALYLCWCGGVAASDKANNTGYFTSNDILTRRNQYVHALLTRTMREQPNHPALIVLANDYKKAVEKAKGLVSVQSSPYRSESTNN